MSKAAYQMARLTPKSKQIDGMGFGGTVSDNLDVAGALAFMNPDTGRKLPVYSEFLARYVYCADDSCKGEIIQRLLFILSKEKTKVKHRTLEGISNAALYDFTNPSFEHNKQGNAELDNQGQPIVKLLSRGNIADRSGIARKNFSDVHYSLYNIAFMQLCCLISDVADHVNSTMSDSS